MPDHEEVTRRSARVLLLDESDRVLLLKFRVDPDDPRAGHGWATPGGGVEPGETLAQAAARELKEETGLAVAPQDLGPAVAETSGYADLGWAQGVFQDVFFRHRATEPLGEVGGHEAHERHYHAGHHWWSLDELRATADTVYPCGLAELLTDLVAGHVPAEPVRLPWHH